MKLTLITVCLNSESTIAHTLESVISQEYSDYEHIIFDGGSRDNTIPIIKSFGDQFELIQGKDSGIFDAMNQAIKFSSGEIIGIINSDDFYADQYVLSKVTKAFEDHGVDSVYGDLHYVYRDDPTRVYRNWKSGEFKSSKFKNGWSIPHPTFFVRKEIYERYGMFDDNFKISGDYELILRFLHRHKISTYYLPEVLVKMRNNGNSDGGIKKRIESLKEDHLSWEINNLNPAPYTIALKPLRKISQFLSAKFI